MSLLQVPFIKMQALRNDFVLLEKEKIGITLTPTQIRWIADRRQGIGCDQILLLEKVDQADAKLSFYNADGSQASACGNGTRCVAKYLGKPSGLIQTPTFLSHFWNKGDRVTISLQPPKFEPLSFLPHHLQKGEYIYVGNSHLVIFTDNLHSIPLETLASSLQPPEGINVEVAQVISPSTLRVKVWERGVGITPACGSGACAVGILSLKLGYIERPPVTIEMEGGCLEVEWANGTAPLLSGPVDFCFEGFVNLR